MKKVILAVSMFLSVAAVNAQDKAAPATNQADIKFEVDEYNFGTIKQGDKIDYDFEFQNVGKEPLVITGASGSCGCTVPTWSKEPIAKGGKGKLHVRFDSTGKMGMQDKTVTVTSNAKVGSKILHLKGNVEAPPVNTASPEKK